MNERSKLCMIGIPDHQAVIGRLGAKEGPGAFRSAFRRLNGKVPVSDQIVDLGDITGLTLNSATNHRLAANPIRDWHRARSGVSSIIVGGGHDHGYSHLLGISEGLGPHLGLGCINIDAHLDVRSSRPKITSGCPFYLAIENGVLKPQNFTEFGIQSHCNGPELWAYVEKKKIRVVPFQKLRAGKAVSEFKKEFKRLSTRCDRIVVSLDLDALASAYAPGVSAPQSEGFTAMDVMEMMEFAGGQKKCISLGIFELNPEHDSDRRTAQLAATLAYHWAAVKLEFFP